MRHAARSERWWRPWKIAAVSTLGALMTVALVAAAGRNDGREPVDNDASPSTVSEPRASQNPTDGVEASGIGNATPSSEATAPTNPPPSAPTPAHRNEHLEGTHSGLEHYVLFAGRCSFLDHHLESTFHLDDGTTWKYDADYCGTIDGQLWTGIGMFTLRAADGATLTGTFTNTARLPSAGVPYVLDINGGTKRFNGASGSCVLENHLRQVQFGVQEQSGAFVCDFGA